MCSRNCHQKHTKLTDLYVTMDCVASFVEMMISRLPFFSATSMVSSTVP